MIDDLRHVPRIRGPLGSFQMITPELAGWIIGVSFVLCAMLEKYL